METYEKIEIKNNEFQRQFEAKIKGELVILEYSNQPRKLFLTKLLMSDELQKQGFTEKFLEAVFDNLAEQRLRIVPSCPTVAKFFRANKRKYKKLLPTGMNI